MRAWLWLGGGIALCACQAISGLTDFRQNERGAAGTGGAASAQGAGGVMTATVSAQVGTTSGGGINPVGTTIGSTGSHMATSSSSNMTTGTVIMTTGPQPLCSHWVFVTAAKLAATDVASADTLCFKEAGVPGTWKAIFSTSQMDAATRIGPLQGDVCLWNDGNGPMSSSLVATKDNWWTTQHVRAIERDAAGNVTVSPAAWSGTHPNGTLADDCADWTTSNAQQSAAIGSTTDTTEWIEQSVVASCSFLGGAPVYCFGRPVMK